MKLFNWHAEKNQQLILERNISFEEAVFFIQNNGLIDDIVPPGLTAYNHQRIFIVNIDNYVYLVPYVENEQEIFLKTIIPSKKFTKKYLGDKK